MKSNKFSSHKIIAGLFGLVIFAAVLPASAFAGLVADYNFNNQTTDDQSGNNNDATNFGASFTADRFNNPNQAAFFDGSNDYIQTPLGSNTLPVAVSVWFQASTIGGERSIVDSDIGGSFGHSLIIDYALGQPSTGNLDLEFHNGATDTGDDGNITAGQWYHAVVCWGTTNEVYLNTTLIYSEAYSPPTPDGSNFRLGRHNSGDPQYFHGSIDDVRFYDECLTQSEINGLFTEANLIKPIPTLPVWGLILLASLLGGVAVYRLKA